MAIASLVTGALFQLGCGSLYAYGVYSNDLPNYGISHSAAILFGAIGNVGGYFALHNGYLHDKYSGRFSAGFGCLMLVIGYTTLLNVVLWEGPPVLFGIGIFIVGQGSASGFLSSLAATEFFPLSSRGKVTSVVLAGFAGSSGILAFLYGFAFGADHLPEFFTMLLCYSLVTGVVHTGVMVCAFRELRAQQLAATELRTVDMAFAESDGQQSPEGIELVDLERTSLMRSTEDTPQKEFKTTETIKMGSYWMLFAIVLVETGVALMFDNNVGFILEVGAAANCCSPGCSKKVRSYRLCHLANLCHHRP